jgi:LysR family glycine cleavage system transcriptional activator
MARNLPPLNSLRAFEAAARHLSFTKAAEELHVTPAAISHQIKALEEQLGVPLFRRLTRALRLTEAGQAALPPMRDGFDRLADAVDLLRAHEESGAITVSLDPSFAAKWLVPRLDRFRAAHPDLDLRLDATDKLADFQRDNVDLAIRYGGGNYPGLEVERLLSEEIFPVCSPKLLEGSAPLAQPGDLRHHTLIHLEWDSEDVTAPTWRMWLLAAGIHDIDFTRGPVFSMTSLGGARQFVPGGRRSGGWSPGRSLRSQRLRPARLRLSHRGSEADGRPSESRRLQRLAAWRDCPDLKRAAGAPRHEGEQAFRLQHGVWPWGSRDRSLVPTRFMAGRPSASPLGALRLHPAIFRGGIDPVLRLLHVLAQPGDDRL